MAAAGLFAVMGLVVTSLVATGLVATGLVATGVAEKETDEWRLPDGFPRPRLPPDNPLTAAKVELGRHLFHDRRLSKDGTFACASCHRQALAFTDGRSRAVGVTGQLHPRSAMSLANVAYAVTLGWDDPKLLLLEEQARVPMFNLSPLELGLPPDPREVLAELATDPIYQRLSAEAFPDHDGPLTLTRVLKALAAFQRTLISGDAPYDRWLAGDSEALSPSARRGMRLFFSARTSCFDCHRGFNFSGPVVYESKFFESKAHEGAGDVEPVFLNTGLYDLDGQGAYPAPNTGVHRLTGKAEDMGRFRVPTLRNIALTAPYMHDGSVDGLEEVIDLYAAGGRTANPLRSSLLTGFEISASEKADLMSFLDSLTDLTFVTDRRFSDPFR